MKLWSGNIVSIVKQLLFFLLPINLFVICFKFNRFWNKNKIRLSQENSDICVVKCCTAVACQPNRDDNEGKTSTQS